MKNIRMSLAGLAIVVALISFKTVPAASIKGKVTPANYAVHAWAITKSDTLYTTVDNGNFEFPNAQPGVYRIVIEAESPYRHLAKDGVVVKEGQTTDLGELSLQKWESTYRAASK